MDEVSPALVDLTNTLTYEDKRSKIFDYFAKLPSSPSNFPSLITRQNSADMSDTKVAVPSESSPATLSVSQESLANTKIARNPTLTTPDVPKRYTITAFNGYKAAVRLQLPQRKKIKIKRETSETDDEMETGAAIGGNLRRQNSRAKLAMFPSLHLDILFEVFSHLQPLDILHLARTTKAFRELLMRKSATSAWKEASLNMPNIPTCPEDMSLPSWVNLIFDTHCQNCLKTNVSKCVDFFLRVRYCNKCLKTELSSEKNYDKENKQHAIILRAVPFRDWNHTGVKYCTVRAKEELLKALSDCKGDRTSFVERRIAEVNARTAYARTCQSWYESTIQERENELQAIRKARATAIEEKLVKMGHAEELTFLQQMDAGFCAIIPWPRLVMFNEHKDIKQPKLLTNKVWENIKPSLVKYMSNTREIRLQHERCLLYQRRKAFIANAYIEWRLRPSNLVKYPADTLMPGAADVLESRDVEQYVHQFGDDDLTVADIDDFLEIDFYDFVKEWKWKMTDELWSLIQKPSLRPQLRLSLYEEKCFYTSVMKQKELLKLAAVVFRCKNDAMHWRYEDRWLINEGIPLPHIYDMYDIRERCMWYPEFIFHPCCTAQGRTHKEKVAGEHAYLDLSKEYSTCRRSAWDLGERLEFDEKASRIVRNLLDASRLDWTTTTVEEMDKFDQRFVCMKCTFGNKCDGSRRVRVWHWRDAVQHCFKHHFGDSSVKWECISTEDTAKARELEAIEYTKRGYLKPTDQKVWKCMRCRDTSAEMGRMTWARLRAHFSAVPKHGSPNEMDDKEGVLYYKALDFAPRERPPVKMIPASAEAK